MPASTFRWQADTAKHDGTMDDVSSTRMRTLLVVRPSGPGPDASVLFGGKFPCRAFLTKIPDHAHHKATDSSRGTLQLTGVTQFRALPECDSRSGLTAAVMLVAAP